MDVPLPTEAPARAAARRDAGTAVPAWAPPPAPVTASRALQCFAVAVFVLGSGAFFAVLTPLPEGQSRPEVLLLWVVAYAVAGAALLDGVVRQRLPVPPSPVIVLFLGLATLSVLWSEDPSLTLRRTVGLTGTVLVGLLLAQRLTTLEILDAVRRTVLIVAVSSLLLLALGEPRAIDVTHDTLRGVLSTKNALGALMALGVLVCSTSALLDPGRLRRCVVSAVPMLLALSKTDSTGATLTALLVLAGTVLFALRARPAGPIVLASAAAMLLGIAVIALPQTTTERVAAAVGEDTTLTGRDAIWGESLAAASEKQVLGYGYGAFWESADAAEEIRARLQWPVPNGHNGLLDVALDLGAVGVLAAVAILGALFAGGVRSARRGRYDHAALQLSIGTLLVVRNLAESGLLQQNTLLTVLMVIALATGRRDLAPSRAERARAGHRTWESPPGGPGASARPGL